MVWHYNYTTVYFILPTNDTNIEEIDVCASERSERADFFGCIFTLKTAISLNILLVFFRNFVGTNDILVG